MATIKLKENILANNRRDAQVVRSLLAEHGAFMVNLMASPGAGKTSSILRIAQGLRDRYEVAVIEGDIESKVDSMKVKDAGFTAVQINTGGACHLDVPMILPALEMIDLDATDLIIVENIGNLVCPAEFDIGADLAMMILSVPEGDDKILKYPLMFATCDALIINKIDHLALPSNDFSVKRLRDHMRNLNPKASVFEVSAYTGEGFDELNDFLNSSIEGKRARTIA